MQSKTTITEVKVTLPTGREFLAVEIAIDCPICGNAAFTVLGHHLQAIRNGLTDVIDRNPDLTLKGEDVTALESLQFGSIVKNPRDN